jgi:hypothetical protein
MEDIAETLRKIGVRRNAQRVRDAGIPKTDGCCLIA